MPAPVGDQQLVSLPGFLRPGIAARMATEIEAAPSNTGISCRSVPSRSAADIARRRADLRYILEWVGENCKGP
jgi:hypothetical protein